MIVPLRLMKKICLEISLLRTHLSIDAQLKILLAELIQSLVMVAHVFLDLTTSWALKREKEILRKWWWWKASATIQTKNRHLKKILKGFSLHLLLISRKKAFFRSSIKRVTRLQWSNNRNITSMQLRLVCIILLIQWLKQELASLPNKTPLQTTTKITCLSLTRFCWTKT